MERCAPEAAMNDFDKAGRYLLKRDPAGVFR
jgi:hypothetical protein